MGDVGITERLAERVSAARRERLPDAALAAASAAVIDCVGVMLAGSTEPAARLVAQTVQLPAVAGQARLIGTGDWATAPDAALANGTSAHALDFDDVSPAMTGHPGAVLVPALLAAGEHADASGQAVLQALVVGFEVAARLGRAMNPTHYARGWHATGTLGAPAAAAAVATLLDLSCDQTQVALGIAASLAAGLRVSFGSMVKPLHAGHAARTGVMAATLAAGGFSASSQIFEAERGFGDLFGSAPNFETALADWSWADPEIVRSGIQVKPFPSCACTHTGIDAMLSLRPRLRPDAVERIDVSVPAIAPQILIHSRPRTGLEGKFSMEYCLAVTLLDGQPGTEQFSDARAVRDDVQALLRRVHVAPRPDLPGDLGTGHLPVTLTVQQAHGETLRAECEVPPGSPERPLNPTQLEQKFLANAALVLGSAGAESALEAMRQLKGAPHVRDVIDRLVPVP
jgi:2-methylcitrate dehydratase PrpD